MPAKAVDVETYSHLNPDVRRRHRRARHPRTGMETASIQPSRDDDVARVPASIFVFPSRSVP